MRLFFFFTSSLLLLLSSCENDIAIVQQISYQADAPTESTKNLVLTYATDGCAKVEIHAALAETYRGKAQITKIKDSLKVYFFNETGDIVSTLSALYGEINYNTGELMVKDSVRLYNHKKKQTLETEALFWNQKDSSIFTESAVIVRSPKGKLFGKGIRTKQDFSNYVLLQPVGSWQIEKNQTIQ
ncbi:MAG: LPS export ABC transporter periplasmic protein LptC [Crocinitomicaceae bacterium]|nr:LPS export ABC transporter periplasmic protein LptC [Crocinitomicaceae bacterium]MDP4724448.1 LPS export ABC transporter periplasmic protein LptC [Crocinitomicaceae bacterium]MDP4738655.1 LPS export ABC transporter periplasmic protein LptC [Crocinitomicaceae bacterium]MDP4800066.1 LPS export ABC transporter periplasmic protein LptC [Crocinitomicaceae bacterium]MDP4806472.1 LPS export ABC transporter periplasmic protein LptC [Crocinitomicaceae bacterium]